MLNTNASWSAQWFLEHLANERLTEGSSPEEPLKAPAAGAKMSCQGPLEEIRTQVVRKVEQPR